MERESKDDNGWTWVIGKHNKHLRSNHNGKRGLERPPPQSLNASPSPIITFHFTNFPSNWESMTMLEVFKRYGQALNVYIPGKRNIQGKRFGFCRFSGVSDIQGMERKLDSICIGTQKLKCNVAHHQRKLDNSQPPLRQRIADQPRFVTSPNHIPLGKTPYANVLKKEKRTPTSPLTTPTAKNTATKNSNHITSTNIQLKLPPKSNHLPTTSFFAELKSINDASGTHNLLLDKGFEDFSIKYVGGLFILIKLGDSMALENALVDNDLVSYFKSMSRWNPTTRPSNQLVWLRISGLPSQLWWEDSFSSIAKHYGDVLIPEVCCTRQFNLTYGKVCVLSERMDLINDTLHIPFNKEMI